MRMIYFFFAHSVLVNYGDITCNDILKNKINKNDSQILRFIYKPLGFFCYNAMSSHMLNWPPEVSKRFLFFSFLITGIWRFQLWRVKVGASFLAKIQEKIPGFFTRKYRQFPIINSIITCKIKLSINPMWKFFISLTTSTNFNLNKIRKNCRYEWGAFASTAAVLPAQCPVYLLP